MIAPEAPVLLACVHGIRSPVGRTAVARLVEAVAARLPGTEVGPREWTSRHRTSRSVPSSSPGGRPWSCRCCSPPVTTTT